MTRVGRRGQASALCVHANRWHVPDPRRPGTYTDFSHSRRPGSPSFPCAHMAEGASQPCGGLLHEDANPIHDDSVLTTESASRGPASLNYHTIMLGSQQKNLGETQNAVQRNTSFLHPFLLHPFKYWPQNCYSRHTEQQTVTTLHHLAILGTRCP